MLNIVAQTVSHIYDVLAFADIPFIIALGVVLVALGFLGKLSKPTQL